MRKGKFIKRLFPVMAGVLLTTGLLTGCFQAMTQGEEPELEELQDVKYVRQVIAGDNCSERTIMWQADRNMVAPGVEYRVSGESEGQTVSARSEIFSDDDVTTNLYTAQLSDLPPGTNLEYRLLEEGKAGKWHELSTDDGQQFTALIFPDSQSNDYSGWKELAQAAAKRQPETDFFINMGDLVDNGEDQDQWEDWFDSLAGIIDRIPVAPLMGNHETYTLDWKVRQPVAYLAEFAVPGNGSSQYNRYYYSYDYGPVHFIVLNTQQGELQDFSPDLLEREIEWFKTDVAATDKPWKVVLMHKDPLQYRIHNRPERTEGFSEEGEIWMPLFDAAGIDAVLSAHLHTYRNRGHIMKFQRNEAGPLYILTGVAGNVRYPGLWVDHSLDMYVAPQPETDNYMVMNATPQEINFFAYLPDGTEIDHAVLKK